MKVRNHEDSNPTPWCASRETPRLNGDLLQKTALHIDAAQEQIERSRQLVARSREIVAQIKASLARAHSIQQGISGNPKKPLIIVADPERRRK